MCIGTLSFFSHHVCVTDVFVLPYPYNTHCLCAFSGFSATSNNRKGGAAGELTAGEAGADDAEVMVARNEVGKMNIRVPYKFF